MQSATGDIEQTEPEPTTQDQFAMDQNDNNYQEPITIQTVESLSLNDLTEKLDLILSNQAMIIQNQNNLLKNQNLLETNIENQTKIFQKLAKLETMMDLIGEKILSNEFGTSNDGQIKQQSTTLLFEEVEPIEDLKELEELEQKLRNRKIMEDYIEKFSFISGTKGNGNGINSAYLLVDRMFSRKFMTLCSWAGGAREKKEKVPFKSYKNVIELFFRVVQLADKNFTLMDCQEFIKNVIRNSTRRNASNNTRVSTFKRRPKSLTYKENKVGDKNENKHNNQEAEIEQDTETEEGIALNKETAQNTEYQEEEIAQNSQN